MGESGKKRVVAYDQTKAGGSGEMTIITEEWGDCKEEPQK